MNYEALRNIVASNSQGRGVSVLCRAEFFENALRLFQRASNIIIVTGFFIKGANASETDGPPGAVALGRALMRVSKSVAIFTDSRNYSCLKACSRSIKGPVVVSVDDHKKIPLDNVDLLVFIERPGRAIDGRYYNMKGIDISDVVVSLDQASEVAFQRGIPVLGIGDGGNEAGMGLLYNEIASELPCYSDFISIVPASVCLPVDVSNWGAYALVAVLSIFYRRWLGLNDDEEGLMLLAMAEDGAVDGVSGRSEQSVDNISLENLEKIFFRIKNWYSENF